MPQFGAYLDCHLVAMLFRFLEEEAEELARLNEEHAAEARLKREHQLEREKAVSCTLRCSFLTASRAAGSAAMLKHDCIMLDATSDQASSSVVCHLGLQILAE